MTLQNDLFSEDLNIKELDGKKCSLCGKIPIIKHIIRDAKGKFLKKKYRKTDRSSRIDCDAGQQEDSKLCTYHKECWRKACGI